MKVDPIRAGALRKFFVQLPEDQIAVAILDLLDDRLEAGGTEVDVLDNEPGGPQGRVLWLKCCKGELAPPDWPSENESPNS